MPNAAL